MRVLAALLALAMAASAADIAGIWMGRTEKGDLSFQFRSEAGKITGLMFGDEFDLPVEDLHIEGDTLSFAVTNVNYYDGRRVRALYTGKVDANMMELTRDKTVIRLTRLTVR